MVASLNLRCLGGGSGLNLFCDDTVGVLRRCSVAGLNDAAVDEDDEDDDDDVEELDDEDGAP